MSLDSLSNQVAKLKEQMPQPPTTPWQNFAFTLTFLFNEEELVRAEALEAAIRETGTIEHLTDQERYELGLLLKLERALDLEDTQGVVKYRRRLHTTTEQLIDAFLALDMNAYENGTRDWLHIEESGCIYPLDKIGYRSLRRTIEQGTISRDTIETLWRWLEAYSPALAV
jgi:hypothetical protein